MTRYALDGYRVVAAAGVVLYHCYQHNRTGPDARWPLDGTFWHTVVIPGVPAVTMFFVLSGFLVGLPYARAAVAGTPLRPAGTVVRRRMARLLPLYYVVVLVVWGVTNPSLPGDWRDLLLHLTFTHVYTDDRIFSTNGPAWFLAVEVHFFLLTAVVGPALVRGCRRVPGRWRVAALAAGPLALLAVSWAYRLAVADVPWERWSVWFSPLAKLDTFAVGLLLAVVAAAGARLGAGPPQVLVALAGLLTLVGASVLASTVDVRTWYLHTPAAAGFAVVVASTSFGPRPPRWLGGRTLMYLGAISFGVYLWQEPVIRLLAGTGLLPDPAPGPTFLLTTAVVLGVAGAVAWGGLFLIEIPLARLVDGWPAADVRRRVYEEAAR